MLSQCLQDFKLWCKTREEVELLEVTLGTPWLVWPQRLPSLLSSIPLRIFLLLLLSQLMLVPICTRQTSGAVFWCVVLPELDLRPLLFYLPPSTRGATPSHYWTFRRMSCTLCVSTGGLLTLVLFGYFIQGKWGLGATWGAGGGRFQIHVCLHQLHLSMVVRVKHV